MAWKRGPLPEKTYGWGGVVPADEPDSTGFYFANFKGDKVEIVGDSTPRTLKAHEVGLYDNCLGLPPKVKRGELAESA